MFNAVVVSQSDSGYRAELTNLDESALPEGDVQVDVQYSTLNYKDALAITGKGPIVKRFPMVPGVDLAGLVTQSTHADFKPGDHVLINGWGVGERHWGGLAQRARLHGDWLIPLPQALQPWDAMAIGSAGYTAMLCTLALERQGITPDRGPILVTGAAGGVGSFAVAILASLGYRVQACSGRAQQEKDFLSRLGAHEILPRDELQGPGKPLQKQRWAGVVDVVGGELLANACAGTHYGGVVTACGLAGGMNFPATVAPFILRGVTLAGVDSVMCPNSLRLQAWRRLATEFDRTLLATIAAEIPLARVLTAADELLAGRIRGRLVVNPNN